MLTHTRRETLDLDLHGVHISIAANPAVLCALEGRLGLLPHGEPGRSQAVSDDAGWPLSRPRSASRCLATTVLPGAAVPPPPAPMQWPIPPAPAVVRCHGRSRSGRYFMGVAGPAANLAFLYLEAGRGEGHLVAPPDGELRPVYTSAMGEALYCEAADLLYLHCGEQVRVRCEPATGETRLSVLGPVSERLWLLAHPLFTLPLIEQLKRRGRYSLHAAGVALGGRALLFPGASGAGKSTLTLALVRAGFSLLGDDMLFFAPGADRPRVLAFPEAVDVTDQTSGLFPELRDLAGAPPRPGWPKRQVCAAERFGASIAWEAEPALLIFPRVARAQRSALRPMDPMEALLELAPNVLLTETRSSQAHLDVLADLVAACDCYALATGRDLDALPLVLRDLLGARG